MKLRLDQALVDRKLVPSRSRARDLVLRGQVSVDGAIAGKPGQTVGPDAVIDVAAAAGAWVSRGGLKLDAALDAFGFAVAGRVVLDVGASTGGFTHVLLARGADRVIAVDVGHGQLAPAIAADNRVSNLEGVDARALTAALLGAAPHGVVADLSFISVTKALGPALALAGPGAWLVVLVKPQFELTPGDIGKGGIVRDEVARERALAQVSAWVGVQSGWRVIGTRPSPVTGGSGNIEYLLGAVRD